MFLRKCDGFLSVDTFSTNVIVLFYFKHLAERLADYRIVIGDQNGLGRLSALRIKRT